MRIGILLATLVLSACVSTNEGGAQPKLAYHPPLPTPVKACPINWVVLEYEGAPYVALTYNDNVQGAICNKDVQRYIKELQKVTCSYREELKEPACLPQKELNGK